MTDDGKMIRNETLLHQILTNTTGVPSLRVLFIPSIGSVTNAFIRKEYIFADLDVLVDGYREEKVQTNNFILYINANGGINNCPTNPNLSNFRGNAVLVQVDDQHRICNLNPRITITEYRSILKN